jgi:ABC-type transport system substrate-binding protein
VQWERANRIVLDPNPYYRPGPRLRHIVFLLIPTTQASLIALRAHDVDVVRLADPAQIPPARGIASARLVPTAINGEYELIQRVTRPPTDDIHVRRAIAAAIDRREIARASFGTLTPADSFLPPVFAWHDPAAEMMGSDAAYVGRELRAGGWRESGGTWKKAGRPLSVSIDFEPALGSWIEVLVQDQLRRVGIDAHVKPFPPALFNAPGGPLRSGRFTLASSQWIGAADPEQSVVFACDQRGGNGNNDSDYCNARFDALLRDQAVTNDRLRRRRDFVEMQRIVRRDAPIAPLAFQTNVDAISDRVSGFARNMLMYPVNAAAWDVR